LPWLDAYADRLEFEPENAQQSRKNLKDKIDTYRTIASSSASMPIKKRLAAGPDLVILATPPGFRRFISMAAVNAKQARLHGEAGSHRRSRVRKVLAAAAEAKKKNLGVGVGLQRRHEIKLHRNDQSGCKTARSATS